MFKETTEKIDLVVDNCQFVVLFLFILLIFFFLDKSL